MKTRQIMVLTVLLGLLAARDGLAFYNPETGRWLNRDPIGESGGLNLYAFVRNDACSWIDPLGESIYSWLRDKCNPYCKDRHPKWPSCSKSAPSTAQSAIEQRMETLDIPSYDRFSGPYFSGCKVEGPARGCPGGADANRDFFTCKIAYFSQLTGRVTICKHTVITCRCCWNFSNGDYAIYMHRSGNDKTSPPTHGGNTPDWPHR